MLPAPQERHLLHATPLSAKDPRNREVPKLASAMAHLRHPPKPRTAATISPIEESAKRARAKLPGLVQQLENLLRTVDPIELLSQLTLFHQTHARTKVPNREETARRQVQLEWLVWLVFAHGITSPPRPRLIDARVLEPLHNLLDEYYLAKATTLVEPAAGLSEVQNELRMLAQLDALHVRGEMFHAQLEELASSLYTPHNEWCVQNLRFTVLDAWTVANAMLTRFSTSMDRQSQAAARLAAKLRANPAFLSELELPVSARDALSRGEVALDPETLADFVQTHWFLSRAPEIVGFTLEELQEQVGATIDPDRVAAVVDFLSSGPESFHREPDPLALSPLAVRPVVRHERRHYVFVPSLVLQSLVHAFHVALYGDTAYRPRYDEARASWLERAAVEAFQEMLPRAESGWGLKYGPKKRRLEVDGLIRYANKLILIECKWKSQTLLARAGDVVTALKDVDKAILEPLRQAKRAREYLARHGKVVFEESRTGRSVVVDDDEITEVFLVTLVGSEAWSQVAANLVRLAPLGLFSDGEYPWALSLNDLRVVAHFLELPSQLFDYLRRRDEVQRDARFRLHDEWDVLGAYLNGALDANDSRFRGKGYVGFHGMDDEIQDYYYRLDGGLDPGSKPRRQLPEAIVRLLALVEGMDALERTDAICVVLSWPDSGLAELAKALDDARTRAAADGRAHAVAVKHPWRSSGITVAYGTNDRRAILGALGKAREALRRQSGAVAWVEFGIDLGTPSQPFVTYARRREPGGRNRETSAKR